MDLTEKTLCVREIFRGRVVHLHVDEVLLPNGHTSTREIIEHPGGVGILAVDDQNRVAMVQQYRYAFGRTLWEIPAGKRETGEDPFTTAQRELQEEVGATAEQWTPMGEILASPGCYAEKLWLFMARGLTLGMQHPDEDEFLEVTWVPLEELTEKCLNGTLQDGKTVCAVLKANLMK